MKLYIVHFRESKNKARPRTQLRFIANIKSREMAEDDHHETEPRPNETSKTKNQVCITEKQENWFCLCCPVQQYRRI
jgi:hypothetical protein